MMRVKYSFIGSAHLMEEFFYVESSSSTWKMCLEGWFSCILCGGALEYDMELSCGGAVDTKR